VVELTYAAKIINMKYHELIKSDPTKQRICTNCPTIVKYVKNKYPQHADKLIDIGSPMVIMSRFVKKEY
jgi:iron only hydrogenase large subunit-like protein